MIPLINSKLETELRISLANQVKRLNSRITLSPTETLPIKKYIYPKGIEKICNLYVSDSLRSKDAKVIFGGRNQATQDILKIYDQWLKILGGKKVSMRLFSGIHSHTLIALAFRKIGPRVLLLPEKAGGHFLTEKILLNLGYQVTLMPVDYANLEIDFKKTRDIIDSGQIDIVFVDRTESLNYTDFTSLLKGANVYSIFDASHYLSNIISGDYKNPFDMGFNLCISTLHKSFPGPQKAVVWSREDDKFWQEINEALLTYVSSIHPAGVYGVGLLLSNHQLISDYSRLMMANSVELENELANLNIPVLKKRKDLPPSYYIYIRIKDQNLAYEKYNQLSAVGIDTNYRLLPYNLGYGLRLGTGPLTMMGLRPSDTKQLALIFSEAYYGHSNINLASQVKKFLTKIKIHRLDK